MGYQEFDIASAVTPTVQRRSVKIEGTHVSKILGSHSTSTEEFIIGAVADMGAADMNIMYVNASLNALTDRLQTAGKIARAVNTAKARGVEGFNSVEALNPWKYAIEGKVSDFFKKIWDAIRTACRRVIDFIANLLKSIENWIKGLNAKKQTEDYNAWLRSGGKIPSGVGKYTLSSVKWTRTASDLEKVTAAAGKHYIELFTAAEKDRITLEKISSTDLSESMGKDTKFNIIHKIGKALNITTDGKAESVANHFKKLKDEINNDLTEGITKVFGSAKGQQVSAKELVMGYMTKNGGKTEKVTVDELYKVSNSFSVLSEGWTAKNIKAIAAECSKAQANFAKYTKTIDKLASKLSSTQNPDIGAISKACSEIANARIRVSSYYSGLMLQLESCALRFRQSAHNALKECIKKGSKKSEESYRQPAARRAAAASVESLFNFN